LQRSLREDRRTEAIPDSLVISSSNSTAESLRY
jgi:hypothetical protein